MRVIDTHGRVVRAMLVTVGEAETLIDMRDAAIGNYFVRFDVGDRALIKRLSIVR